MFALIHLSLLACTSSGTSLSAVDELTLSATNGAEEALTAVGNFMSPDALPDADRPDPFRQCDASATYADLFGRYDADANGELDTPESDEVFTARGDRSDRDEMRVEGQWAMLLAVYDLDGSGVLEESERATMLDDFTARCEALQAQLVAEFDTDGDGVLSDTEQEAAREALDARHGDHTDVEPDGSPCDGDGAPPDDSGAGSGDHAGRGGPPDGASEGGPPDSTDGRPAPGDVPPPLVDEFDTDGDGTLDDAELTTMRDTMRDRIRNGDPLCPPPPGAPADETDTASAQ
jgi:Ca2+-binding EF-hand superfamily protein